MCSSDLERMQWYVDLGIRKEKLRLRPHDPDELAHYAKAASDVEYEFPFGWQEVEGIANRTDFDLKAHQEASGEDLTYFDQEKDERYLPYVVEPAAGVDRIVLTALVDAFREEEAPTAKGGTEKRTYLALQRTSRRPRSPSCRSRATSSSRRMLAGCLTS